MHWRNRLFITLGLAYGLAGGLLALIRLAAPGLIPGNVPRAHGHLMLLGFFLMVIYGIGLHVLPRFSGTSLYSERMADAQLYFANLGLPLMVAGWLSFQNWLVAVGGLFTYAAIALFGINIFLTMGRRTMGS